MNSATKLPTGIHITSHCANNGRRRANSRLNINDAIRRWYYQFTEGDTNFLDIARLHS